MCQDFNDNDDGMYRRSMLMSGALTATGVSSDAGTPLTEGEAESSQTSGSTYIKKAQSDWPEISDMYSCRVPDSFEGIGGGDIIKITVEGTTDEFYFGVYGTHGKGYSSSIRMGKNARERANTEVNDEVSWEKVDDEEAPSYIDYAKTGWYELGSPYTVRVPPEDSDLVGDFVQVSSLSGNGQSLYSVAGTHNEDYTLNTLRMSSAARERLGDADIASPVEYKPSSETSGRTYPKPTIEYAKTKWDNVGDEFAVRLSKGFFEHSEYQIDQLKSREDNIWIERSDTKQANCFGYWAQHDQDGFWPSIRMGSNARERLGHVDTGTQCEVKKFTGIWPRMGVALSDWGEEVGNALLCGINEKTAAKLGVEKGDMVTVRSRAFNQKRVFQVHRVYSDHETDRMRAVMRTARWGRHRFTNADGASVKNDSPRFTSPSEPDEVDKLTEDDVIGLDVEIEPFEPEEGQKYVGVSQARSEWDFSMTNERVFFHEELVDEFNILTKFDGEPIDRSFEPEEANVTEGWDNLRLHHADYPDDRYQAYTAYGTYSDDREVPRIRMTWFARRHLNNPEYDDEVFDKGQWDQDRHGVPRSFVVQLDTDTEYQVPNPDLRKPDIDEPALRNSTGTVEQEVQAIAEQGLPHANVYHPTVYEEEESAEWYKDSPDKRFLPFAPHGGDTEWRTSRICYYIAQELDTPYWIHEGYRETIGSSFDRWHTTSSDMRNGYPAIEALGFDWDYSLSIHGFTADGILVGGLLDQELRETYGGYLVEALPDEDVHVYGDDHPSWAESFAGTNPRNITNEFTNGGERNGRGGIQLELPSSVRTEQCKWVDVAEATIAFYRQEMNIE